MWIFCNLSKCWHVCVCVCVCVILIQIRRKGSLKGRKWMSIFNIGGRFHEPWKRSKNSQKGNQSMRCAVIYQAFLRTTAQISLILHVFACVLLSEKDRSSLRPARSMDSLTLQTYTNEGTVKRTFCFRFLMFEQECFLYLTSI